MASKICFHVMIFMKYADGFSTVQMKRVLVFCFFFIHFSFEYSACPTLTAAHLSVTASVDYLRTSTLMFSIDFTPKAVWEQPMKVWTSSEVFIMHSQKSDRAYRQQSTVATSERTCFNVVCSEKRKWAEAKKNPASSAKPVLRRGGDHRQEENNICTTIYTRYIMSDALC